VIYLASQSPRRKTLLAEARLKFMTVPSLHDEVIHANLSPEDNALWNALLKCSRAKLPASAQPAGRGKKTGIILAADTLIDFKGKVIIKPRDRADAARILKGFSGRTHTVITAAALKVLATGRFRTFTVKSRVTFKKLSPVQISAYLDTGEYKDKAGAYGYQEHGRSLVSRVRGSETNVIGLPMEKLLAALRQISKKGQLSR
jgi:septum formation protein